MLHLNIKQKVNYVKNIPQNITEIIGEYLNYVLTTSFRVWLIFSDIMIVEDKNTSYEEKIKAIESIKNFGDIHSKLILSEISTEHDDLLLRSVAKGFLEELL